MLTTACHHHQRLRDAIDARIAEEQARQKAAQDSISRSNSSRRQAARPARQRRESGPPARSPDPTEFEAEFAIGDDDSSSRSATPRQDGSTTQESGAQGNNADTKQSGESAGKEAAPDAEPRPAPSSELPADVRSRLRRLDKLESKYQGMDSSLKGRG